MLIHSYISSCFGFGDFIRGHITLVQKYGIENVAMSLQETNLMALFEPMFFASYKSNSYVETQIWYNKDTEFKNNIVCTNAFFNFPISKEIKTSIQTLLEPNNNTKNYITQTLKNINLVVNNFNVLHIRNSSELTKNELKDTFLTKEQYNNIVKIVEKHTTDDTPWLVCTDTYENKLLFDHSNFVFINMKPAHSSDPIYKPLNVLLEHFIMRHSNKIIQVTDPYPKHFWGSGYSDSVNWIWGVPVLHYDTQGCKKSVCLDRTEGLRLIKR